MSNEFPMQTADITNVKPDNSSTYSDTAQGQVIGIYNEEQEQTAEESETQNLVIYDDNDDQASTQPTTQMLVLSHSGQPGTFEANIVNVIIKAQTSQSRVDANKDQQPGISNKAFKGKPDGNFVVCEHPGCGRLFSSKGYLKHHQQMVHNKAKKDLMCNIEGCERKFLSASHLKYHKLSHRGERSFACYVDNCDKKFLTSQRLKVHLRTHTGEKPFKCQHEDCEKSFTTAGNLKNHMRIHTGERPFVCPFEACTRTFAEQSSLKKHILVHSGDKPYPCSLCGKSFTQSSTRNTHLKMHTIQSKQKENAGVKSNLGELSNSDLLVMKSEEGIIHYQTDFQGSEPVVYSHPISDLVVTVTTETVEGDTDNLDLTHSVLGAQEELASEVPMEDENCLSPSKTGANVVVISQPHDIVSLENTYQNKNTQVKDEVYGDELLTRELEDSHSSMVENSSTVNTSQHAQNEASRGVTLDPILNGDVLQKV